METIESRNLVPADLPDPRDGRDIRAIEFALTFDGYRHVGGPDELSRLALLALDEVRGSGRLPRGLSIDDLRAIVYFLARSDYPAGGYWLARDELALYTRCINELQRRLVRRRTRACPSCGSTKLARIQYGLPPPGAGHDPRLEDGSVVLGGCLVGPDSPDLRCRACGHEYRGDGGPRPR